MSPRYLVVALFCLACVPSPAQSTSPGFGLRNQSFTVKLLSPLSTKNGREGDTFTATVEEPSQYQGGLMEGRITKLKKPKKGVAKGKAEVQFQFDTLTFSGQTVRIAADLRDVMNSQGVRDVDEEGNVISRTSNRKRIGATIAGGVIGGIIGGLLGGGRGAATGAAAGAAAGLVIGLTMTTSASDIEFRPGSLFTLSVSDSTGRR